MTLVYAQRHREHFARQIEELSRSIAIAQELIAEKQKSVKQWDSLIEGLSDFDFPNSVSSVPSVVKKKSSSKP